ncbi:MAG: SDR family oxidoreductase [Planctomycetota bacterium]|jgi:citronellol/citronellal dehydrogenase
MTNRSLHDRVLLITGGSRGIGLAIAERAARDGAKVALVAKTAEPHPKLPGTVYTAAEACERAGGEALPIVCDIRDEAAVEAAVAATVERFGRLDALVNNASAIFLAGTRETPMKRFDLMHQVNVRGTYLCSQKALPHLLRSDNPHILNLAPPLNFEERWFAPHTAYSIAKFGMSLCTLGMSGELREQGVAVNSLWPRTTIATAAVRNLLGGEEMCSRSRKPEIMGDAAQAILTRPAGECSGNYFIDEEVLAAEGVTDFDGYAVNPGGPLQPDFFV